MFKKFLDKLRPDRDEDDTVKVKGKVKPKYYGTVTPYPYFNASSDADLLEKAIKNKKVDEDVIMSVLLKRSNEQRQKIKEAYEASTGHKLELDLKDVLSSDMENVTLALLLPPAQFDCYLIRKATKCFGTDEDMLVEILATRTNEEIREIKRVYPEVWGQDLEYIIKDETTGDFCGALLSLLEANKDENPEVDVELSLRDAQILYEKGQKEGDICEKTFIEILTKRSGPQLRHTLEYYKEKRDISLPKLMKAELSGDLQKCFIDLVKIAWNKPAFFAEKLHAAMEGNGTCEDTLTRILVGRSEIDLKKIVEEYRLMFDAPIQDHILRDTDGPYEKVLLSLCGPH